METIKLDGLTNVQKTVSALLAFECMVKHNNAKQTFEGIQTAIHACNLLDVPSDIVQEIYSGKIKGLPNLYKADGIEFDTDYLFKLQCTLSSWFPIERFPGKGTKIVLLDLDGMREDFTLGWVERNRWKTQTGERVGLHSQWTYLDGIT